MAIDCRFGLVFFFRRKTKSDHTSVRRRPSCEILSRSNVQRKHHSICIVFHLIKPTRNTVLLAPLPLSPSSPLSVGDRNMFLSILTQMLRTKLHLSRSSHLLNLDRGREQEIKTHKFEINFYRLQHLSCCNLYFGVSIHKEKEELHTDK